MAEPPATTPAVAVPAERDALLATKLHLPRTRPGMVARPRLADRLAQARAGDLTVVSAPAGFGKTTSWPAGPWRSCWCWTTTS